MDTSVAIVTVSVAVPVMNGLAVAVIVVLPAPNEVATPLEPAALLMVATAAFEDVQVMDAVRSRVVKSEYVPVAINC